MSKCDLTIEIEGGQQSYEIGDTVSGFVHVRVDSNCKCDGLSVSRLWRTHGRGNRTSGDEQEIGLFKGEWRAGENHSYPFSVTIPEGPVTYHGHYLNVDHYLTAVADIPWAFDPSDEVELVVLPSGKGNAGASGPARLGAPVVTTAPAQGFPPAFAWLFGLMFGLPGLGVMIGGVVKAASGDLAGLGLVAFGSVFVAVGGFVLFLSLRNSLAEKKLGAVVPHVSPSSALPGAPVSFGLDFTPQGEAKINSITAVLKGCETVVSGSGTNRTTHTHTLHEEKVVLKGEGRLFAREVQELAGNLTLPADAAPSFAASDNNLTWSVDFHIDIASWPDWTGSVPVWVEPVVAG